jgi:hypothetical protein
VKPAAAFFSVASLFSLVSLASLAGCEPVPHAGSHGAGGPGAAAGPPSREPTFAVRASKTEYDKGLAGLHGLDSLRGTVMTQALATDLGFKCAELKEVGKRLVAESDPLVWRLRSDIDKTCGFDVPIACARFEVQSIERKRAGSPGAAVERECSSLKLAIGDTASKYLQNPAVLDLGDKFLTYCGTGGTGGADDGVRRIP